MPLRTRATPSAIATRRVIRWSDGVITSLYVVTFATMAGSRSGEGGLLLEFPFRGFEWALPSASVVLVLMRRAAPWPVLVGLLSIDFADRALDITSEPFGTGIALASMAMERSRRHLVVASWFSFAVVALSVPLAGRTISGAVVCLIVYGSGAFLGALISQVGQQRLRELRLNAQVRLHRASLHHAREREQVVQEVHDVLTHSLALTARLSDVATAHLATSPANAAAVVDQIGVTARTGMRRVREYVRDHHDAGPGSMQPALQQVVGAVKLAGVPIELDVDGAPPSPSVEVLVVRTVEEALTNVLKHSEPSCVSVDVRYPSGDREGSVTIRNDGVAGPTGPPGTGILGSARRHEQMGAIFSSGPAGDGSTWIVRSVLPKTERARSIQLERPAHSKESV